MWLKSWKWVCRKKKKSLCKKNQESFIGEENSNPETKLIFLRELTK